MRDLDLLEKSLVPEYVQNVSIAVNQTCFFKCRMCSFWKNNDKDLKLDLESYNNFFKELKTIKGKDTVISFTGGEPLSNPQIFDLIVLANKQGFYTNLTTNGWLVTKKVINKFFASGLDSISFSVDGSCSKIHDSVRNMKGSFKKIKVAAKEIREYFIKFGKNVKIDVNTVIFSYNLDDIENIAQFVQDSSLFDSVRFQAVAAPISESKIRNGRIINNDDSLGDYWYKSDEFGNIWPKDKDRLLELYTNLIMFKKKNYKINNSVQRLKMQYHYFLHPDTRFEDTLCKVFNDLSVHVNGDVSHCVPKHDIVGNIHSDSILDKWESMNAQKLRKDVINCDINCHQLINCGFPSDNKSK